MATDYRKMAEKAHIRATREPVQDKTEELTDEERNLAGKVTAHIRDAEAEEGLEIILAIDGWERSSACIHLAGQCHKNAGRLESADDLLQRAVIMRKQEGKSQLAISSLNALAINLVAQGRRKVAMQRLDDAIGLDGGHRLSHFNKLCLLSLQKDLEGLANAFDTLDDSYPGWPRDVLMCEWLEGDATLGFLRESQLWHRISERMNQGDGQ